ncbi:aldo/keto reductase [Actinobacillus vicugnae]|uniref:aldo/keto reductase n=1 Tax=Actinobacillus vicugnae TaxID=2573093 RepID=UPI0012405EA8|nr:aldo/keto reductase [Actinobacillus vicugnae]
MKQFPKIALGTWSWGAGFAGGDQVFGNHLTDEQMADVFDTAMQAGLNLWDTAAVYGMGSSENALGAQVRRYAREELILSTKFTPQIVEDVDQPAVKMLEDSLARLGTDYIDVYWIHNPFDVEKMTPYMIDALNTGKIKQLGVSNHNLAQIKRVQEILGSAGYKLSAVQNHYSLLYRSSEESGIWDYCRENNLIFYAYMVLEQGALTGRYNAQNPLPEGSGRAETYNKILPKLTALTDKMTEIGKHYDNANPAQIAIAWAIAKGTLPLIGATKPHHVLDSANAAKIVLHADEIEVLEKLANDASVNTKGAWENPMI